MELHALDRERAMAHAHDLAVGGARDDGQHRGARGGLDHERVIARRLEGPGEAAEDALPFVLDRRRLAVHQAARAHDAPAEGVADRLVAEADAEERDARAAEGVMKLARAIEQIGYDHIDMFDHVVMGFPMEGRPPGPYPAQMPILEALMTLSYIAAVTTRVGLGTEVLVLPQRHPTLVAKQVSTLDTLSGGRVRLGVGVGWQESEYEALGEDFHTRGARMDEAIRLLRACWSDTQIDFKGRYYQLTAIGVPSPGLYVSDEIAGNRFAIAGGTPGARVSWQVTGSRHDAYAKAFPIPVEEDKAGDERGRYLAPEAFGQPPERAVGWRPQPPIQAAEPAPSSR